MSSLQEMVVADYPIIVPKDVFQKLLASPYFEDTLALLTLYMAECFWSEGGGQVKLSVREVAEKLKWAENRVRRAKRILRSMGVLHEEDGKRWDGVFISFAKEIKVVRNTKKRKDTGAEYLHFFPAQWIENEEFVEAWTLWEEFRAIEKKKPLGKYSVREQVRRLIPLGVHGAIDSLRDSINGSWAGVFPSKHQKGVTIVAEEPNEEVEGVASEIESIRGVALSPREKQDLSVLLHSLSTVVDRGSKDPTFRQFFGTKQELLEEYMVFLRDTYTGFKNMSTAMLLPGGKAWLRFFHDLEQRLGGLHLGEITCSAK